MFESAQSLFIVVMSFIAAIVLLSVVIIPGIVRAIDNYQIKKLEKDLKAKYGENALRAS